MLHTTDTGSPLTAASINNVRHEAIRKARYDPLSGNPDDPGRREVTRGTTTLHVPESMLKDPAYTPTLTQTEFNMLRFRHDFEFWAATCVKITDKESKKPVPFILNRPQRRLLTLMEGERTAGMPIRVIMVKARQWGGSTLVQVYFAWIQIVHRRNWHSLICAHFKDTSSTIRGMYSHLLAHYPAEYWTEECAPEFRPFERMGNTRHIPGRGCRITVCSSENQESARGMDCSMAHLSEVAFWRDSLQHNPVDLIRSVTSGIALKPLTCVVLESTANGVGNFFHREWLRAVEGKSDKAPFFVPWYEIDMYTRPVDDPERFLAGLNDYERALWEHHGCTLEAINWYRKKSSEYADRRSMMAEFPTTAEEAFTSAETNVFTADDVERLREGGCSLSPRTGEVAGSRTGIPSDISEPHFIPCHGGKASVWVPPRRGASYIASLDIGGRSHKSDYSVLTILGRHTDTPWAALPEVAAQWRGHSDHDLLAWTAAAMARWYNTALLVVESNTWETSSEGSGQYILRTLADEYPNMYFRAGNHPGFHTNVSTKASLIAHMIRLVREGGYIEHDNGACDELLQYEALADGGYAARRGCHDDILMSRAIALWVHATHSGAEEARLSGTELCALLGQ